MALCNALHCHIDMLLCLKCFKKFQEINFRFGMVVNKYLHKVTSTKNISLNKIENEYLCSDADLVITFLDFKPSNVQFMIQK